MAMTAKGLGLGLALLLGTAQQGPELSPGLIAEYYELGGAVEDFPVLPPERKPTLRRIEAQVNVESTEESFAGTGLSEAFYVRWTGVLRAPAAGKYTFYSESDDGSRVFIGETKVIDNNGLHPMEEKSGEIELKAGDHPIRIEMFENTGQAGCRISWEGPGLAKEIIPARAFYHAKDKDLDR